MRDFLSLGISSDLVHVLNGHGITKPTPIQEKVIPLLSARKDVIAQSQTGTGKTFAFVLPILSKIDVSNPNIQTLIVIPTRELAIQITNEINKLLQGVKGVNILAVYGGQDVESQLKKLKKNIHIVIGTPGRLLDHQRRGTVDFSKVSFLVLDEADQMLHIGFLEEVEQIISETPWTRQTMLFSATMPGEIRKLALRHMKKPKYIQVEKTQAPMANIKQIAIGTTDRAKQSALFEALRIYRPFLAVIFCRTKRRVSKLYDALKSRGFNCGELHGDLSQAKREEVMKRFRNADIQFLVATDVAARGLDVDGVTHVFNYDIPQDSESYIHRIGRTGRAGSEGLAITFFAPKDRQTLGIIEKDLNLTIVKKKLGNGREIVSSKEEQEKSGQDFQKPGTKRKMGKSSQNRPGNGGTKFQTNKKPNKPGSKPKIGQLTNKKKGSRRGRGS